MGSSPTDATIRLLLNSESIIERAEMDREQSYCFQRGLCIWCKHNLDLTCQAGKGENKYGEANLSWIINHATREGVPKELLSLVASKFLEGNYKVIYEILRSYRLILPNEPEQYIH